MLPHTIAGPDVVGDTAIVAVGNEIFVAWTEGRTNGSYSAHLMSGTSALVRDISASIPPMISLSVEGTLVGVLNKVTTGGLRFRTYDAALEKVGSTIRSRAEDVVDGQFRTAVLGQDRYFIFQDERLNHTIENPNEDRVAFSVDYGPQRRGSTGIGTDYDLDGVNDHILMVSQDGPDFMDMQMFVTVYDPTSDTQAMGTAPFAYTKTTNRIDIERVGARVGMVWAEFGSINSARPVYFFGTSQTGVAIIP